MALALRVLVPAGFMPESQGHRIVLGICADGSGTRTTRTIEVPALPGRGEVAKHAVGHAPCTFAALSLAVLGGGDPLPAIAPRPLVRGIVPPVRAGPVVRLAQAHLRPPLRGPPADMIDRA